MFGFLRRRGPKVIGKATRYSHCMNCGKRDCQTPVGRGEVITRGIWYLARQYHICQNCGAKSLWHRRLDKFVWTLDRDGTE